MCGFRFVIHATFSSTVSPVSGLRTLQRVERRSKPLERRLEAGLRLVLHPLRAVAADDAQPDRGRTARGARQRPRHPVARRTARPRRGLCALGTRRRGSVARQADAAPGSIPRSRPSPGRPRARRRLPVLTVVQRWPHPARRAGCARRRWSSIQGSASGRFYVPPAGYATVVRRPPGRRPPARGSPELGAARHRPRSPFGRIPGARRPAASTSRTSPSTSSSPFHSPEGTRPIPGGDAGGDETSSLRPSARPADRGPPRRPPRRPRCCARSRAGAQRRSRLDHELQIGVQHLRHPHHRFQLDILDVTGEQPGNRRLGHAQLPRDG